MSLNAAIAVYAVRYALGRRTGAPEDVLSFVREHADEIRSDAGCREAILRDIEEHDAHYGLVDSARQTWMSVRDIVDGDAA